MTTKTAGPIDAATIDGAIERLTPEVTALRHELHQHPEVRFEERWTSDRIAAFLVENNIPHERGFARGTGIVATIEGRSGKTVALRADIDALEIQELSDVPYVSRIPNRMHACGHDGHTAALCGAAKILHEHREHLTGTIKCIFQPAEEIAGGGKLIVDEGVLKGVDAVFALHGWPSLPVGTVAVKHGCMMASATDFYVDVHGRGCHGAQPSIGVDPVMVAAHITTALQTIVSREINPTDPAVVSVGKIEGGSATNIIPDSAYLEGTFRSLKESVHSKIRDAIIRVAEETAKAFRARADVRIGSMTYPPLYNDNTMVDFATDVMKNDRQINDVVELEAPTMGAEDFAFYLQKVPGAFVFVGVNPDERERYSALHTPYYDFTDDALPVAMSFLTKTACSFLSAE